MRYALGIEYDGTDFHGWQRLSDARTVQAELESALGFVADHAVELTCAGRTDAGVHARCQVAHFDSDAQRSRYAWVMGANSRLPAAIAVRWCQAVPDTFSARFSARARRYRYRIINRRARPALEARQAAWVQRPLDVAAMQGAADSLLGERDFSAFRSSQCQARHARRNVQRIAITRLDDEVRIEIRANAFLHHMVRNIVGSLIPVGLGEQPQSWLGELLERGDRRLAGPTAPARGLLFIGPLYPADWSLPSEVTG